MSCAETQDITMTTPTIQRHSNDDMIRMFTADNQHRYNALSKQLNSLAGQVNHTDSTYSILQQINSVSTELQQLIDNDTNVNSIDTLIPFNTNKQQSCQLLNLNNDVINQHSSICYQHN